MTDVALWVLELEIGGSLYRWSETALELESVNGPVEVSGGLTLDEVELGEVDTTIELLDPSLDWVSFAKLLDGSRARVLRVELGGSLESAREFAGGVVVDVSAGSRNEPIGFTITAPPASSDDLGDQVPDPAARIWQENWSLGAVDIGFSYPVVFGIPGFVSDTVTFPVVPVPVGEQVVTVMYLVIALGKNPDLATVRIRREDLGLEADFPIDPFDQDRWDRELTLVEIPFGDAMFLSNIEDDHDYYVGFYDLPGGGGVARTLFDVMVYLLERWGRSSVDWPRLRAMEDELAVYNVDSWIDEPVENPWVVIEGWLEDLPFEIRRSSRGRYLERLRFLPDGARVVRRVEVGVDATRASSRTFSPGELNQYSARYKPGRESGQWLSTIVITGDPDLVAPPPVSIPANGSIARSRRTSVLQDGRLSRSFARYGRRQAEFVDLDWTFDADTALRVLEWQIERDSIDHWVCDYWVQDGHDLRIGDEVLVTDAELGLENEPALVMSSPVANRTAWVRVELRYLA